MENKTVEPHRSSLGGLDANIMALIVYIVPAVCSLISGLRYLGWIVPLVLYFVEAQSNFVRFHALQSFVLNAINAIVSFLIYVVIGGIFFTAAYNPLSIFGAVGIFGLFALIASVVGIAVLVFSILAMVNAYKYVEWHVPFLHPVVAKVEQIIGKR